METSSLLKKWTKNLSNMLYLAHSYHIFILQWVVNIAEKKDKCNYEKQKEQASLITHIKKSGLDIC